MTSYVKVSELKREPIYMNVITRRQPATVGYSFDPEVFGPSFWFTLHNGSTSYPINPSQFVKLGMKNLLINLPLLIPCINCREHFYAFLRSSDIDSDVSSKENLF